MRIISGIAGGIRLKAPVGYYVRPTNDGVKETIFNILGDLSDAVVADLFSGSGALGLEALSRGAATVIFVERERRGIQTIRENLAAAMKNLGGDPEKDGRAVIVHGDVATVPERLAKYAGKLTVVLADPPYEPNEGEYGAIEMLQDPNIATWTAGALLALEHGSKTALPWSPHSPWELVKQRKFGIRCVSFARQKKK